MTTSDQTTIKLCIGEAWANFNIATADLEPAARFCLAETLKDPEKYLAAYDANEEAFARYMPMLFSAVLNEWANHHFAKEAE